MNACKKSSTVKRVVLTSSIVAVQQSKNRNAEFTEEDWNTTVNKKHEPYDYSKFHAEKKAWEFMEENQDLKFDLVVINPGVILGPSYSPNLSTSVNLVKRMVVGDVPGIPKWSIPLVDVRDVAKIHLLAMVNPKAKGRYLAVSKTLWMKEVADILGKEFPKSKVPKLTIPNFVTYVAAIFDRDVNLYWARYAIGVYTRFSNTKSIQELGIQYMDPTKTLVDSVLSFIELGIVPKL